MDLLFSAGDPAAAAALDPIAAEDRRRHRSLERTKRRRTLSHRLRVAVKQATEQHADAEHVCQSMGIPCWFEDSGCRDPCESAAARGRSGQRDMTSARRHHLERNLKYQHWAETLNSRQSPSSTAGGRLFKAHHRGRPNTAVDDDELELARSSIPMPSDRNRLQRHPSLGREDAFCDASTFKARGAVRVQSHGDEDAAQIAELYRMGLLYDDNDGNSVFHDDGTAKAMSGSTGAIDLNTIYHDQPSYTIRPAKRSRRLQGRAALDSALHLDLSFADLGADGDLSRYLLSPASTIASETATNSIDGETRAQGHEDGKRHTRKVSAPLRVVYELDHNNGSSNSSSKNSQPSFDVDTSQPPDLIVDDSLSDYDCFTESDIDEDMPSQEVDGGTDGDDGGAGAATASGAWVLLGNDS